MASRMIEGMRLRTLVLPLAVALMALAAARGTSAQHPGIERLPPEVFDVVPPSARVRGEPGAMTVHPRACRTLPTAETRRRIVDVAAQEWSFFGSRIAAPAEFEDDPPGIRGDGARPSPDGRRGRRPRLPRRRPRASLPRLPGTGRSRPKGPGSSSDRTRGGKVPTASPRDGTLPGRRHSSRG